MKETDEFNLLQKCSEKKQTQIIRHETPIDKWQTVNIFLLSN